MARVLCFEACGLCSKKLLRALVCPVEDPELVEWVEDPELVEWEPAEGPEFTEGSKGRSLR
jgi:hypothetical protein